jgi:pilus assembly protein FimV
MERIRRHLSYANVAATLALVFAMTGGAVAATGGFSSGGALRACVNGEGTLKLLKPGKHCGKGQQSVAWDQTGPAGANGAPGVPGTTGAAGAPGATGAKGADGAKGAEGREGPGGESFFTNVVVREKTENKSGFISVNCEPGEVAIGGGGTGESNASHLYGSGPVGEHGQAAAGETPIGWYAQVEQSGFPITVYALCAS